MLLIERITAIRDHTRRHPCCWEIEQHLDEIQAEFERRENELQAELQQLLAIARANDRAPVSITVTTTDQEGTPVTTFAPGATITFTAASENAEKQPVADSYTWTTTAGTIVAGADSTTVTISDAPLGDVTVTATDPLGVSGQVTATVADQTPATVTVTAA